ncbi:MAG: GPR endopeptidase [Firmicutes bacterium]|nr:GPR endopeptidase [Bacillota bacterium]
MKLKKIENKQIPQNSHDTKNIDKNILQEKNAKKRYVLRTDMAMELMPETKSKKITEKLKRIDLEIDESTSKRLKKPKGKYITLETQYVKDGETNEYQRVSKALSDAISGLVKGAKKPLVACLGNPKMTADSLGRHVGDRLMVTRSLDFGDGIAELSCICPNVLGVTGVESFDIIKGVVDRTNPDVVIVVDSLASAATSRLASAFQVSDSGITPGSGVSNHRMRFDEKSLRRPVISVGVPLVVYASTIIYDAIKGDKKTKPKIEFDDETLNLIVTPKDIDLLVEDCAIIIAKAINLTFFGNEML